MRRVVYLPDVVGGGYRDFWQCRQRYRVVKGGKGSKKSSTAALWYIYHMMKYPEANLLVVRQVARTHEDSTFAQLMWAIDRLGVNDRWQASRRPPELTYTPTGQRILFRGFDDVHKLASTTVPTGHLCWVWVEEAFEIAREEDFDKLDLSVPRGKIPPPLFKQTTLTFNPWNEKHWLKKRFFDQPDKNVFTMTATYLGNEFLDDTDRAVFEQMRVRRPRQYAVAGLGEWGVSEGLIFEHWQVGEFDREMLNGEGIVRIFGLDYGYTNDPTAFIAAAVDPVHKKLYVYDEHYQTKMLNSDIAAMIVRKGYAKERIRADSAEPKSNEELRRLGISRVTAADKGADSIRSGIARLQEYDITVHPRCPHTACELAGYVWQTEGGLYTNRPADTGNHLMDALRYAMEDTVYFHPTVRRKKTPPGGVRAADVTGGWTV